jgi:hypothetical protein
MSTLYDQDAILIEVEALLASQQSVALVGPSERGKRTMVECLSHRANEQTVFVVLDCAAIADGDVTMFFERCTTTLHACAATRNLQLRVDQTISGPTRLAFEEVVRQLDRKGLQVVLALVSLEYLAANPKVDIRLFNALRSAAARLPLTFLTTSQLPLIDLTYVSNAEQIRSSPFFNIFVQITMA